MDEARALLGAEAPPPAPPRPATIRSRAAHTSPTCRPSAAHRRLVADLLALSQICPTLAEYVAQFWPMLARVWPRLAALGRG